MDGNNAGVTLSIVAHELERYGKVVLRSDDPSAVLGDARVPVSGALATDFLYLIEDAYAVEDPAGRHFLFVGQPQDAPAFAEIVFTGDGDFSEIFALVQDIFWRFHEWARQMDGLLLGGYSSQDLLDASEGFLVNHVVVVDPALKLLAHSKHIDVDDPVTIELVKHGYHTDENIKKFKLNKRFKPWATEEGFVVNDTRKICKYTTVVYSFKTPGSFSLITVMMCNRAEPQPWLFDTFRIFLVRLGHIAKREYSQTVPSGNTVDSFLRDLVSGDLDDSAKIAERSEFAGLPVEGRFCLFDVLYKDGSDVPKERIIAELATRTAPAKVLTYEDGVIVFCFNCRNRRLNCPKSCHTCSLSCSFATSAQVDRESTVVSRIEALIASYGLVCGRSTSFTSLAQVRCAYLQAKTTARLIVDEAEAEGSVPKPEIYGFDDHALEYMAKCSLVDGIDIVGQSSSCQALREIRAQDARRGTDDYEVLRSYLRNERRTVQAAAELNLHRNSLRYRIEHLTGEYGLDLDDPRSRWELCLASFILDAEERYRCFEDKYGRAK